MIHVLALLLLGRLLDIKPSVSSLPSQLQTMQHIELLAKFMQAMGASSVSTAAADTNVLALLVLRRLLCKNTGQSSS